MTWVVRRTDQGRGYLANPGSEKSYTQNARSARRFTTREEAETECCSNETPELR